MRVIPGYKVGATALAAVMTIATGAAARQIAPSPKCAKADEVSAIQAAAVQQQLMVAALTCNEIARFNSFQTNFGPELRASDATLAKMFKRLYGARQGEAEYHSFKTRLANDSSIRSIHDNVNYCQQTGAMFATALMPQKPALVNFVSVVQVVEESPVSSCDLRVALTQPAATVGSGSAVAPATATATVSGIVPQQRPQATAAATNAGGLAAQTAQQ
ncbi:MAG TPA: hypothetical protein VGM17_16430 [Rhizomicrobium sp.]|jgi:hypothetical protein